MDDLEEITSLSKNGFFKTVFMVDKTEQSYMMNIMQYTLLAMVPVVLVLKLLLFFQLL